MNINILCSSKAHPVNEMLYQWVKKNQGEHDIRLVRSKKDLIEGDLLFLISCSEIINAKDREKFKKVLVIHASDLPKGRGWSPHIWAVVNGEVEITITLLEAEDKVDSGDIWEQKRLIIPKHALYDEINGLVFEAESDLMDFAVANFEKIKPRPQNEYQEPSYYPKRTPDDSELDPQKSLAEQFDLIRVCDPGRFPSFFKLYGHTYKLTIEKMEDE